LARRLVAGREGEGPRRLRPRLPRPPHLLEQARHLDAHARVVLRPQGHAELVERLLAVAAGAVDAREQEVDRAVVGVEVGGARRLRQRSRAVAAVEEALGLDVERGRDLLVAAALPRELEGTLAVLDPLEAP